MEQQTRRSHPLARQEIKEIQRMPVPIFRKWIMTYSMTVYNLGIDDCKDILHDEFGFGGKRLQRLVDRLMDKQRKVLEGDGTLDGEGNLQKPGQVRP